MNSNEKVLELLHSVKELTDREREQFATELLLMMLNQPDQLGSHLPQHNNPSLQPNAEADCKELAMLLRRLNYQHDDYIHRII
jgi:hypothetical protein